MSKALEQAKKHDDEVTDEALEWTRRLDDTLKEIFDVNTGWDECYGLSKKLRNDLEQFEGLIERIFDAENRVALLEAWETLAEHSPKIPSDEWIVND